MSEHDCEQFLVSALAFSDGETPLLSQAVLKQHLDTCDGCRLELAAHDATGSRLKAARRPSFQGHLWSAIAPQLRSRGTRAGVAGILGIAALAACVLRGAILTWSPMLGWLGSAATIAIASTVFLILRENPFALPEGLPAAVVRSPEK